MDLEDIAAKVANHARLTPHELDFWKRSFRETQQRNAFLSGIIGSDGSPVFSNGIISNGDIQIGKNIIGVESARVKTASSVATTNNVTLTVPFDNIEYNEGVFIDLAADATKINILTTGIYKVFFGVIWEYIGAVSGLAVAGIYKNALISYPRLQSSLCQLLTYTAYDERLYAAGDYLQLKVTQTSGGSVNAGCYLGIAKVRSNS